MFPVCIVSESPPWDALPVAKIVRFSNKTPILDRIYAQAQLCYVPEKGLFVRLWSFETPPVSEDHFLRFSLMIKNDESYTVDVTPFSSQHITPLIGEDLQGKFWGGEFVLKNETLSHFFEKKPPFSSGFSFEGNFFNHSLGDGQFFENPMGLFRFISF